jgi:hypothetical protein
VDERRARARRESDELERISALEIDAVVVALLEADGSPVEDVHCRNH